MPVPSKPFTFSDSPPNTNLIVAAQINSNYDVLYRTLDPGQIGLDDSNVRANSLTAASLAAGPALIATPQAWQTVAMTGWSASLPYMKNSLGFVHVRTDAITAPASVPQGTTIATLPPLYRPVTTVYGILIDTSLGGGGIYAVSIDTAGVIANRSALAGSKPYCFNFVPFRAEN